jgi:hypothetical protein
MTKDGIRTELRRSAAEDLDPWVVDCRAFSSVTWVWLEDDESLIGSDYETMRILYLLVAEAA